MPSAKPLTPTQRDILTRYHRGDSDHLIARAVNSAPAAVSLVIEELTGFSKDRAAELLRTVRNEGRLPEAPTEPDTTAEIAADPIQELLTRAAGHSQQRIRAVAARLLTGVDELRTAVAAEDQAEAARARVARLEAELAEARSQLPGAKPSQLLAFAHAIEHGTAAPPPNQNPDGDAPHPA